MSRVDDSHGAEAHDTLVADFAPGGLAELPEGSRLGRYVILSRVGKGGMGVVYAAYDPTLDRRVALKVLVPAMARGALGTEGKTRLLREAQALAKVSHPNVVHVHDVGTWSEQIYIAMEYVEGDTLRAYLARTPRTVADILHVFEKAGAGLGAAHAAGLVHRDFKPGNVIVDGRGRPKVVDFGLARAQETVLVDGAAAPERPRPTTTSEEPASSSDLLATPLTELGQVMGTPEYMAPEQIRGLGTDHRADQFAFCVSLYEALCGRRPFSAPSAEELFEQVERGAIPPPPKERRVPAHVVRAIERGLSPHPDGRFASMDDLLAALARDPGLRLRRVAALAAVGSALVTMVALGAWVHHREGEACRASAALLDGVWDEEQEERVRGAFGRIERPYAAESLASALDRLDEYAAAWAARREESCTATRVHGEQPERVMALVSTCLDEKREELGALVAALGQADEDAVQRAPEAVLGLSPIEACADVAALEARVPEPDGQEAREAGKTVRAELAEGRAGIVLGRYQEAREIAARSLARAVLAEHGPLEAEAGLLLGQAMEKLGTFKEADTTLDEAALAAEASGHDEALLRILTERGTLLGHRLADTSRGRDACRRAEAVRVRTRGTSESEGHVSLCTFSVSYAEGKYDEALAAARRARSAYEEALGEDSDRVAIATNNIGNVLVKKGEIEAALEHFRESARIWERIGGPNHPSVASALVNQGIALRRLTRFDEALAAYRRAEEIRRASVGDDHPDMAAIDNNMAVIYSRLGQLDEAKKRYERAHAVRLASYGPLHPNVAMSLLNLGVIESKQKRYEEALALFRQSLAIREKAHGKEHASLVNGYTNVAFALQKLERYEEALEAARRSLAIAEAGSGGEAARLGAPLTILGETLVAAGRPKEALEPLERALVMRERDEEDRSLVGSTRFALARALWDSGQDKVRARSLAEKAEGDYRAVGGQADDLAGVEAWLRDNR